MVSALIATIFAKETEAAARDQWRTVADQLRMRFPKIVRVMDDAEDDVVAHMGVPKEHRSKIYSINPLERLNVEIKNAAPTCQASSPTKPPSIACSAPCWSSRTRSGRYSVVT